MMQEYLTHPIFHVLAEIAEENNIETYVIGGYVRTSCCIVLPRISILSFKVTALPWQKLRPKN